MVTARRRGQRPGTRLSGWKQTRGWRLTGKTRALRPLRSGLAERLFRPAGALGVPLSPSRGPRSPHRRCRGPGPVPSSRFPGPAPPSRGRLRGAPGPAPPAPPRPWPPRARAVPARSRRGMAGPRQVPGRGGQGKGGGGEGRAVRQGPAAPGRAGAAGSARGGAGLWAAAVIWGRRWGSGPREGGVGARSAAGCGREPLRPAAGRESRDGG